jgi:hypothetical protein
MDGRDRWLELMADRLLVIVGALWLIIILTGIPFLIWLLNQ